MCKIFQEIWEEGFEEGFEKGFAEGRAIAIEKANQEKDKKVISMLKDGLPFDKIASYTDLPIEKISELAASLNAQ